eukprot:COSAG02_NODE_13682_length_1361_cov_407.007126_2_plen_104_part_01
MQRKCLTEEQVQAVQPRALAALVLSYRWYDSLGTRYMHVDAPAAIYSCASQPPRDFPVGPWPTGPQRGVISGGVNFGCLGGCESSNIFHLWAPRNFVGVRSKHH